MRQNTEQKIKNEQRNFLIDIRVELNSVLLGIDMNVINGNATNLKDEAGKKKRASYRSTNRIHANKRLFSKQLLVIEGHNNVQTYSQKQYVLPYVRCTNTHTPRYACHIFFVYVAVQLKIHISIRVFGIATAAKANNTNHRHTSKRNQSKR